jgi:hypothetical protein
MARFVRAFFVSELCFIWRVISVARHPSVMVEDWTVAPETHWRSPG